MRALLVVDFATFMLSVYMDFLSAATDESFGLDNHRRWRGDRMLGVIRSVRCSGARRREGLPVARGPRCRPGRPKGGIVSGFPIESGLLFSRLSRFGTRMDQTATKLGG